MIVISHRGNLRGPNRDRENFPTAVDECLKLGLNCEVDLRMKKGALYLGHDSPDYKIELDWLKDRSQFLWVHCKDWESLRFLKESGSNLNFFWHQEDSHAITSKGVVWNYPGGPISKISISVLPENWLDPLKSQNIGESMGICTDYPLRFYRALLLA